MLSHPLLQVVTPAAGGPAEGAGMRPQDAILVIGDKPTDGMSLYEAASLLQVNIIHQDTPEAQS